MEDIKERLIKYFTLGVVVAIAIGGLVIVWPTYQRGRALRRENSDLQRQIDAKREQVRKIAEDQIRLKNDPDFVEKIARQNGRVFPGELVFIFGNRK